MQVFFAISGYLVMLEAGAATRLSRVSWHGVACASCPGWASSSWPAPRWSARPSPRWGWPNTSAKPASWGYLAKMLVFPAQHGLPGVFAENPYPGVVNGSLWSLRLEFAGYLGLGRGRGGRRLLLGGAACCCRRSSAASGSAW